MLPGCNLEGTGLAAPARPLRLARCSNAGLLTPPPRPTLVSSTPAIGRRACSAIASSDGTQMCSSASVGRPSSTTSSVAAGILLAGALPHASQQQQRRRCLPVTAATKRQASSAKAPPASSSAPVVERIEDRELHVEAKMSYLAYAMSVLVDRALPDVRDGLKPVHRRILYAMHDLGLTPTKAFKKCARVVGEVLGKYHPHGDQSVYNALVRLAQDFSMREPLISGHGNFGSLDDDPAAAMRYTECRLRSLTTDSCLTDLHDGTVDFVPTFDGSQTEPEVLPARVPLLLVNGAMGIAVGMATHVPPHNLREVVAALRALIADPDLTTEQLMQHVPAPDFPTGGTIVQSSAIADAYRTGRGGIVVRGAVTIESPGAADSEDEAPEVVKPARGGKRAAPSAAAKRGSGGAGGPDLIVVTEMPYLVSKVDLVLKIAALVESKVLDGVADVRDESDRTGMRVVVEVRKSHDANVVLNQLYKHTRLQTKCSANMVALVDGSPEELNLRTILQHFIDFRVLVIERRARHYLAAAQARLHLVDGFLTAMGQADSVVQAIRAADDTASASAALQQGFQLSAEQAAAVLALPLRRLASQEQSKLVAEQKELTDRLADLQALLGDRARVLAVVGQEAQEVADKHGNARRSVLVHQQDVKVDLGLEDMTLNRQSFVMWSRRGFVKRVDAQIFEQQIRGGKGKSGGKLRQNDSLEEVVAVHDHDQLLLLSEGGKGFAIKAHQVPDASRTSGGTAIAQLIPMTENLIIAAILPVPAPPPASARVVADAAPGNNGHASPDDEDGAGETSPDDPAHGLSVMLMTEAGAIKRLPLALARSSRKAGVVMFKVPQGDRLAWAAQCGEKDVALVASSQGRLLLFPVGDVRQSGRASGGTRAMRLKAGDHLVSLGILPDSLASRLSSDDEEEVDEGTANGSSNGAPHDEEDDEELAATGSSSSTEDDSTGPWVLTISSKGYGKRTCVTDLRIQKRGQMGFLGHRVKAGAHLCQVHVVGSLSDEIVMATSRGQIVRISAGKVALQSKLTQGVKLINMGPDDTLQAVTIVRNVAAEE